MLLTVSLVSLAKSQCLRTSEIMSKRDEKRQKYMEVGKCVQGKHCGSLSRNVLLAEQTCIKCVLRIPLLTNVMRTFLPQVCNANGYSVLHIYSEVHDS